MDPDWHEAITVYCACETWTSRVEDSFACETCKTRELFTKRQAEKAVGNTSQRSSRTTSDDVDGV